MPNELVDSNDIIVINPKLAQRSKVIMNITAVLRFSLNLNVYAGV